MHDNINNLLLGPIISHVGTASFHLSKHLANLLPPQSQSEYTVKNKKGFIEQFKSIGVPQH